MTSRNKRIAALSWEKKSPGPAAEIREATSVHRDLEMDWSGSGLLGVKDLES